MTIYSELCDETMYWMAENEPHRPDVADLVAAFALASFVDGVAVTPRGHDVTHKLGGDGR